MVWLIWLGSTKSKRLGLGSIQVWGDMARFNHKHKVLSLVLCFCPIEIETGEREMGGGIVVGKQRRW